MKTFQRTSQVSENLNEVLRFRQVIYCDGCCPDNGNGGSGAGAAVILRHGEKMQQVTEYIPSPCTNQRAEIIAACIGLENIAKGSKVIVVSDSQYVVKTGRGEYRKKANVDLWFRLEAACLGLIVEWEWTKGHNGDTWNEVADTLATECYNEHSGIVTDDIFERFMASGERQ